MKKIHNIDDLQREKRLIDQRRLQLEKELHRDWNDLKDVVSNQGSSFFGILHKPYALGLLSKGLSFGAGMVAKNFGGKIGRKIDSWFK